MSFAGNLLGCCSVAERAGLEEHLATCVEGLHLPEIGERLAIPVGTAKSRLSRALGKLREDLDA